jgi:two-component system CheB/CheR fusion protein
MKILLVEDHEDTRAILQRILSRWGHDVEIAEGVQAGMEAVQARAFDVILSDIGLPDGSGYALMSRARHIGSRALGIAISAYPYPSAVAEPGVTGFDYHLNKPLVAGDLRRLLEFAQVERRPESHYPSLPC